MDNNEIQPELHPNSTQESSQPDTKAEFETWLRRLAPRLPNPGPQNLPRDQHQPDFIVTCRAGDCQISFTGVLHIEGFFSATIRSEDGTLTTGAGLIDGNIDVAAAHIDGSVIGNVRASERVVLYSEAKVAGNIIAPALSTKSGALFEGNCILHEPVEVPRRHPLVNDQVFQSAQTAS